MSPIAICQVNGEKHAVFSFLLLFSHPYTISMPNVSIHNMCVETGADQT